MQKYRIRIVEETINTVKMVEILGVMLNTEVEVQSHISNVMKVCRFHNEDNIAYMAISKQVNRKSVRLKSVVCSS